ncbi:hypothetical protein [Barrientosiimonas endolithica]|uniref:hypothetical protein n=1 Tax=Barrientosiimonas endolithica TaxID=1535208 RepID=UPI00259B6C52|nr:hypothetical protein [Barrientosiimonas endolithica]
MQVQGDRVTVAAGDSDAIAWLLLSDLGARNLEISSGSLEAAFLTITGGAPAAASPRSGSPPRR